VGLVGLGDRPADLQNTLDLPAYARMDGGLYYQRGPWNANVYLENITNTQYAQSSINSLQIFQGAPFNARAAISYWY
jgi:iron complex outermembrane receptor protein